MKHLLFAGQDMLAGPEPALDEPPDSAAALAAAAAARRDFELEGTRYVALMLDAEGAEAAIERDSSLRRMAIREALAAFSAEAMAPALRGIALLRWLETARFCGACGSPLEDNDRADEDQGGRRCAACGRVHFPRISPAVIVLVRKGERALLAHNARFRQGFFGLIAGFVEAGETFEEAAVREAREEAGIEIRGLRYVKSQPWPFPDSLMVAFTAEWASGEARPDGIEIAELRWCLPGELPDIPAKGSVARYLIDEFLRGAR
jgi:NAD+ diphosphatase